MARSPEKSSPGVQLWMILTVLAVLTAGLVAAYFLLMRREMAVVFSDLRPTEAAAIVAELDAGAVPYELRNGGTTILVSASEADAVRIRIAGADLPVKGLDGFELFDASDLGLTDFAQRIKYQRAMQGELARTIMKIDGVTEARVHLSIPERSVFRGDRVQAKAAVTLLTRSPDVETPETIAGVQELVAAAITDLAATDVVVLNGHGQVISHARVSATTSTTRKDVPAVASAITTALPQAAPLVSVEMKQAPSIEGAAGIETPARVHIATATILTEAEKSAAIASLRALDPAVLPPETPVVFDVTSGLGAPTAPATLSAAVAPAIRPASQPPSATAQAGAAPPLDFIVAGLILIALLGAFLFVVVTRVRPALSLEDQRRFADRLKLGLRSEMEEPGDVAR